MEEKTNVIYKVKKSTGKTVTIVILLLLLLTALSYIGYTEYQKLLKEDNTLVDENETRNELYYSEVEKIMNQIDMYNNIFKGKYPIDNVNDIDNQLKLQFGIYALQETENIHNYYKIEDIKEMYKNFFVDGFNAVYEDIECPAKDNPLYELNSEKKIYTEVTDHAHGSTTLDIDTYYVKGSIDENVYTIDTNVIFSNYCSDTCNPNGGYYKSYNDVVNGTNPVFYKRSDYKDEKDDLPITTYTFIKEKSNYKLESIKVSN